MLYIEGGNLRMYLICVSTDLLWSTEFSLMIFQNLVHFAICDRSLYSYVFPNDLAKTWMVTSQPWNYGFVNVIDIYRVWIIISMLMTQGMDNIEWNKRWLLITWKNYEWHAPWCTTHELYYQNQSSYVKLYMKNYNKMLRPDHILSSTQHKSLSPSCLKHLKHCCKA